MKNNNFLIKIKKIVAKKINISGDFILWLLLAAGFGLKIYFVYFGYIYNHYIVPPGYDAIPHLEHIQSILATGKISFSNYPPGFYFLVIALGKIFNQGVSHILTYWTPMLIILPAGALYFFLSQLFDRRVSVFTTIVFLLASNFPLYAFVDGNYPDMLAYGFLTLLLFAFLIRYFKTKNRRNLAYTGLILLLIAVTHHFTFFIVSAILVFFALTMVIFDRVNWRAIFNSSQRVILSVSIVIIIIALYFAFHFYGATILAFAKGVLSLRPGYKNAYLNQPTAFVEYPLLMGSVIWYLGFLGIIYLIIHSLKNETQRRAKLLVLVWVGVLYLFSRMSSATLPGRFSRELAVPLTIAIAFLLDFLLKINLGTNSRIKLAIGGGLLGYLIIMNSSLYTGLNMLPNSFNEWIWFWPKDQEKLDYLAKNVPLNDSILFNVHANLYMPVKTHNKLLPLELTNDEEKIANSISDDNLLHLKQKNSSSTQIISEIEGRYKNVRYILIDVKPPSNPNPVTYWPYAGFEADDAILKILAKDKKVLKKFPDGAELVQLK